MSTDATTGAVVPGLLLPPNMELPFFAYGIFRPGQLAYFQLSDSVAEWRREEVRGTLLIRDGLPIADLSRDGTIRGAVLAFVPGESEQAYRRIAAMEPRKQYRWVDVEIAGSKVNLLKGLSPSKGSVAFEGVEWDGWDDPLLSAALDVVQETLDGAVAFEWDLKPLFRLQMAYLLLWSSIERYVSLRYHLGRDVSEKIGRLAAEQAFGRSLQEIVVGQRQVFRADKPTEREVLDPLRPAEAVRYYYQVRSNITHRGKGVVRDHETVQRSLTELLAIFREVLGAAKADAGDLAARGSRTQQSGT